MLALASKKGVALTVGIAAAIIGSSFLIWYIPQGSSPDVPRTDGEVISDIYVQSLDAYVAYLDALAQKVANGDRTNPDPVLYENWQNLIDRSVAAMPINN